MINTSIFKAYDIRGIYPKDINEEAMEKIAKAIYTFFLKDFKRDKLTVVLGRDMRTNSPSLYEVAKKTLVSLGAEVLEVGLVSTPTLYFALLHLKGDVGIQISASHNPKEYGGVKFAKRVNDHIEKVSKNTGMSDVKALAVSGDFVPEKSGGSVKTIDNILVEEVKQLLRNFPTLDVRDMNIVADAANGMGSLYLSELKRQLPFHLTEMNFELDGTFPAHQPDPLEFKNLAGLQQKVKETKADFGIGPDGDGDRIFFVDETGSIIPATIITSLVSREILKGQKGGKILVDVRYTRNAKQQIELNGGVPLYCQVGHALITHMLNQEHGLFAGESSGHFYFKKTGGAESSLLVVLYVLQVLKREGKKLSEVTRELQTSFESGEFNYILPENVQAKRVLDSIANEYKGEISWMDGLSVDFPDWRFSIRSSNTEPLMRLNVEGAKDDLVQAKRAELTGKIMAFGAKPKE